MGIRCPSSAQCAHWLRNDRFIREVIIIHNKTDAERIKEFNAILQKYRAGRHNLEKRCLAAENWWRLRNSAEEAKEVQSLSGFKAVSGWLHNVIVSKHADGMDAYPQPNILPREPGDRAAAAALGKILPVVLEQNDFEQVYSEALWQKLKTGTGVFKVVWDSDKLSGLGDISIQRVDLLSLYWEPGVSDIQKSPCLFQVSFEDNEELISRYPQLRGRLKANAFNPARYPGEDAALPEGKSLLVEVWYKKPLGGRKILHCCRYVGDVIIYDSEAAALSVAAEPRQLSRRESQGRIATACGLAMTGGTGDADCHGVRTTPSSQLLPLRGCSSTDDIVLPFPIEGQAFNGGPSADWPRNDRTGDADRSRNDRTGDAGDADCHGLRPRNDRTGDAGDAEWSRNDKVTTAPQNLSLPANKVSAAIRSPEGIYAHGLYPYVFDCLFPIEGGPCGYGFIDLCKNPQTQIDLLQTAFIKNTMVGAMPRYFRRIDGAVSDRDFLDLDRALVTVDGNLGEDSLRPIDYRPLSGNYLEVRKNVIDELRETSGNTETSSGVTQGGVTAASAIAALQEASGKGSRDASRSSYRAYAKVVELCIELMREFYTLPRCFRITGQMGAEDFVSFSNQALLPRPLMSDGGIELGIYRPVFDVKVIPQRQSPYNRMSQNELALQFYNLGFFEPGRSESALGCLEMMDFEGRDALMQRISQAARRQRFELLRAAAMRAGRLSPPGQLPARAGAAKAASAPVPGGEAP